jgi:hypothetical protein
VLYPRRVQISFCPFIRCGLPTSHLLIYTDNFGLLGGHGILYCTSSFTGP